MLCFLTIMLFLMERAGTMRPQRYGSNSYKCQPRARQTCAYLDTYVGSNSGYEGVKLGALGLKE